MSNIDRVAKAIEDAQAADLEFKYDRPAEALARAAIAVMREPTPRMLRMLQVHIDHGSYAINAWKDTIDVAAEDEPETSIPAPTDPQDTVTK